MGKINYQKIYTTNKDEWKALTREPQKYEALLAGHYSESNHFVYELLQNAEDEKADRVVIEYYDDKLVFYPKFPKWLYRELYVTPRKTA